MKLGMSDIQTSDVTCPNGIPAFYARPKNTTRALPVVILMHERYGLVQHAKDQAVRCARDGFATLAPNFFYKHPDQLALNKGDSRYDITDPEAIELLDESIAWLTSLDEADMTQLAVAGYCQTGRYPLVYAAKRKITAAIVWYGAASKREWEIKEGQPETLESIITSLSCPVFAAFGSDDHIISVADVRRFRDALEDNNKDYDINIYSGAPHGWLNDTMPGRYRKAQAEAGWAAQQAFLTRVLYADSDTSNDTRWRFVSDIPKNYDFSKNKRQE